MKDAEALISELSSSRKALLASFGVEDGEGMPPFIDNGLDYWWVYKDGETVLAKDRVELFKAMHIGHFHGRGEATMSLGSVEVKLHANGRHSLLMSSFLSEHRLTLVDNAKRLYLHLSPGEHCDETR